MPPGAVPAARGHASPSAWWSSPCSARGCATHFGPQLRLDGVVSEALYAGDHRAVALNDLLAVLTAPGLSWFRFVVFLPVLVLLVRRRAWWTTAWVVTAVALIGPLNTAAQDLLRAGAARLRRGRGAAGVAELPERALVGIATLVTVALVLAWPLLAARARHWALAAGRRPRRSLVGLTRMWLGVHFLSDVVGGWALGLGWALLTALLFGALAEGRAALRPLS